MLRKMERDIFEQTRDINSAIEQSGISPNFIQKKILNRVAHRQATVLEITEKMRQALIEQLQQREQNENERK
ncbi:MAG: hypothetical protein ABIH42_10415 [Planctomycetota bacterium]